MWARGADARAKRPTAPGPPAAARSVMPRRDTGPAGTTEKRPPPAKSKGSGHTACPFFQVSSAYSKQKRCFSYRTTLCVFLSSKSAGFYSELPNLTENPPLRGPDELNRQYAYFIAAYALRFRPQSACLHCFRYSSLVIIMWRKPSSTPNSRKPALRWVSHAVISFRATAKSLWILKMPQSRNA